MSYLTELKAELAANASGWYTGDARADAAALNLPRASIALHRDMIPMHEVYACVVWADFAALAEAKRHVFQILTSTDVLDVRSQRVRDAFVAIFGAGSASLTALQGILTRPGSRAEQVWGYGFVVTAAEIDDARRL